MKMRWGASGASASALVFVWKPPSSATSRGVSPSRRARRPSAAELVLARVARRRRRREEEAARPRLRARRHLRELLDVAELGRLAELALADRACVRVEERDEPVSDRLAGQPLRDLLDDLLAALDQRLQAFELARILAAFRRLASASGPAPAPSCAPRRRHAAPRAPRRRAASPSGRSARAPRAFASPVLRRSVRPIARSRLPTARERSCTLAVVPPCSPPAASPRARAPAPRRQPARHPSGSARRPPPPSSRS